ncbi:MAG TPA: ABC transporter permease [Clostridiaceae bacterium]|nr:ABC transporter permease [Clostridiaceae bacterium]
MGTRLKHIVPALVVLALLIGLIQLLSAVGIVRSFVLPAPSDVLRALITQRDLLWFHLRETLSVAALGFVLSIILGIVIALLMDAFPLLYRAFYPLLVVSQTIPTMIITPVIVLMFGYGLVPRLVVVLLVCFFPVSINLLQGFTAVDQDQIRLLRTLGAKRRDILRHVKFPSSLVHLFSGIRIAATYCVMAAVLAEWSGGGTGLGIYMLRTKRSYSFDRMFASIILIIILSLAFYYVVILVEKLAMPWKHARPAENKRRQE